MSSPHSSLPALVLAFSSLAAQATTVTLPADGQWHAFTVDSAVSTTGGSEWVDAGESLAPGHGSALRFDFVVGAGQVGTLTVVDAGLPGDVFRVFNHGLFVGATHGVALAQYDADVPVVMDFDAALADGAFSSRTFILAAGVYSIGGDLLQSVMLDGVPLNATAGALRLTVSLVPEIVGGPMALAAACGMAFAISRARRRG